MRKEYRAFIEELSQELRRQAGFSDSQIYFTKRAQSTAASGDRLFVECASYEDGKEVCGIYTEELFEDYQNGVPLEKIADNVIRELEKVKKAGFFEKTRDLLNYERVKDELFIRLLNKDRHQDDLKRAVYRTVGDIALVLYMRVGEEDGRITSMKIRREYVEAWGLDEEKVFQSALLNTYFMSPPRIYYWENLIYDPNYQGENFMDMTGKFEIKRDCVGNCLSTAKRTNGAVAAFLPGVAKRLAQLIGQDYYLVFTSVHEVMIHNASLVYPEDLEVILRDTIKAATPEEDYLTSRIYRYCRATETFICV